MGRAEGNSFVMEGNEHNNKNNISGNKARRELKFKVLYGYKSFLKKTESEIVLVVWNNDDKG